MLVALVAAPGIVTPDALCAGPRPADAASREATPQQSAENALTRLTKGDYASAAQQTIRALRATPADPNLHILAGVLLLHTGNGHEARTAFQNALDLRSRRRAGPVRPGIGAARERRPSAALDSFARAERGAGDKTYTVRPAATRNGSTARRYRSPMRGLLNRSRPRSRPRRNELPARRRMRAGRIRIAAGAGQPAR